MKYKIMFLILVLFIFGIISFRNMEGCTTAIIGGDASKNQVPMLWKNRDTNFLSNKIIYVKEKPYNYIGIVNAEETSGRYVYAGLNSAGFGIINSVAYNLPKKTEETHDLEGQIMADALRTCNTVDDFEKYIKKNLGANLGSWANFGVIDADGSAVIFEVHNNGYNKLDTKNSPEKYYINSNFSRSGKTGNGEGYLRFEQATALFKQIPVKQIDHKYILQNISRDFGHQLAIHPSLKDLEKQPINKPFWVHNRNCINRYSTSSAIVINGKSKDRKNSVATLWAIIGEPVTSIAIPLWVEAESVPLALYKGKTAAICAEALRIKKIIHPFTEGSKNNYMDVSKLVNKEGKGFLSKILKTEKEIFDETEKFLMKKHTAKEYAAFQNKMADKALQTLRKIN